MLFRSQRSAEDLPAPRASCVAPDIQNAPTLEALLEVFETALADPDHGLTALGRARDFEARAVSERARERTLRVEREISRREDAARAAASADHKAERDRKHNESMLAQHAERKRLSDLAAQEARQHAELLAADLQRTARLS